MEKILAMLFVALVLVLPAGAEEKGRPDPTGRGRYVSYGKEVPHKGARVLKQLPESAECGPATELVGARVWNSTKDGVAILSEISDKAQTATADDGSIFLCECAKGYNQLFMPEPDLKIEVPITAKPEKEPPVTPVTPATTPIDIDINVNVDEEEEEYSPVTLRDACPNIRGLQPDVPRGRVLDDNGNCVTRESWGWRNRNRLAVGGAAVATGTYWLGRYLCWW